MFNEHRLYNDIVATWGTYGAHADVFRAMLNEIQQLRSENDDLKETVKFLDYDVQQLRADIHRPTAEAQ